MHRNLRSLRPHPPSASSLPLTPCATLCHLPCHSPAICPPSSLFVSPGLPSLMHRPALLVPPLCTLRPHLPPTTAASSLPSFPSRDSHLLSPPILSLSFAAQLVFLCRWQARQRSRDAQQSAAVLSTRHVPCALISTTRATIALLVFTLAAFQLPQHACPTSYLP
mmetsp:Transcript_4710/g.8110  ORF Transcript_4710/g.8110 Transcript_4710/m.8110 type:complete len:165 (+) Transcript_4710:135-629(+)